MHELDPAVGEQRGQRGGGGFAEQPQRRVLG